MDGVFEFVWCGVGIGCWQCCEFLEVIGMVCVGFGDLVVDVGCQFDGDVRGQIVEFGCCEGKDLYVDVLFVYQCEMVCVEIGKVDVIFVIICNG